MTRGRNITTGIVFLATFLWLLVPVLEGSPAVLWPSVVAVGLAFVTRDIYLSLFLGAFAGAILLRGGNVATAFLDLFVKHLIPALTDPWNVSVLVFTLMMGGFVEVLNRGGGMTVLAERVLGRSHSARRAGMGAYFMGWLVFFDGLANSMLVGKTMRPMADRAGLSREKLAFIVDSTSSPIAGLALISTWVAYEMSVIRQGFENTGNAELLASVAPYQLLVQSLPYRFYNWFCLLIVFLVIWMRSDFGPMAEAERKAADGRAVLPRRPDIEAAPQRGPTDKGEISKPKFQESQSFLTSAATGHEGKRVWLAIVPLAVLVCGVFGGLFVQGGGLDQPLSMGSVIAAFGKADAAMVFVCATAVASVIAMAGCALFIPVAERGESAASSFFEGMRQMFPPTLILVFAWVLNGVIKELGAAPYLVSFLEGSLPMTWLPALVFMVAALISFSTGTSWGTMAITMPLVIPVAVNLTGMPSGAGSGEVLIATIGAVLAGAVFGDHCSPISDTTIVSAFSSGCDAIEHVRTQLPYALLAAAFAVVTGYAPAGWGVTPWLLLPIGALGCWGIIRFLARS